MSATHRGLEASDRDRIEGILRSDGTFRDDEVAVALELVDDALENAASDYWFRLALIEGEVAGYICYGPTPMTESTYDLYWIVTDARFRGKGVARYLIETMEAEVRERHAGASAQVRVETSQTEGYGAARKLYDRLGYPETARFRDFYKPGDDLIVFYKALH